MSSAKTASSATANDKQAELRKKIEYQVACEERAHRIVERLIDNPVAEEMLLNCLHFITTSHYDDVVVERAVSKLCGYPLCPSSLNKVLKQKYMISTKTNKVYDLETRKNFCSSKCYKASLYLEKQIFTDPLWSRKSQQPRKYELLPLDMTSGKLGDEIIVSKAGEIKNEVEKLSKLDKYEEALKEKLQQREQTLSSHKGDNAETEVGTNTPSTEKNVEAPDRCNSLPTNNSETDEVVYTLDKALSEMTLENADSCVNQKSNLEQNRISDSSEANGQQDIQSEQNQHEILRCQVEHERSETKEDLNNEKDKKNAAKPSNSNTKQPKSQKATKVSSSAKTDYLMQLLDKRKHLLSKMADIQPNTTTENKQTLTSNTSGKTAEDLDTATTVGVATEKRKLIESVETEQSAQDSDVGRKNEQVSELSVRMTEDDFERRLKVAENEAVSYEKQTTPKVIEKTNVNDKKVNISTDAKVENEMSVKVTKKTKQKTNKNKADEDDRKARIVTSLDLICENILSWITQETVDYLQPPDSTDKQTENGGKEKTPFERHYEALVAKVDAQEKDFERLPGEESMEDSANQVTAPLPHFEILQEEAESERQRIAQFMKGAFTYKIQERPVKTKVDSAMNMLPMLDRYDQMLIRQKIVLDRLSKVLPNLLSPLRLLIQDVFTEIRELVFTFNLTKDNIMYKPAEWTIVALVLLKMLARVLPTVSQAFHSPGCERVFTVLLAGIHSNMEDLQSVCDKLLNHT